MCAINLIPLLTARRFSLVTSQRFCVAACLRFTVAKMMVGCVDEYHRGDDLVAWASTIIKGDTLRAMWFYQKVWLLGFQGHVRFGR